MSQARILTVDDANPELLATKKVSVMGFGSQGAAHAKLLREGGVDVRVGLREGSDSASGVRTAGIPLMSVAEAAKQGNPHRHPPPRYRSGARFSAKKSSHIWSLATPCYSPTGSTCTSVRSRHRRMWT